MRQVLQLGERDARRVPWKNGRGYTDELALWPAGASFERGDFDWRVARAAIEESGPFSSFPGFERVLVATAGDGLVLEHGDDAARARVRPLEPYRFSGDWETSARLTSGRVEDLNVLSRRGRCAAEVEVLRLGRRRVREQLESAHVFVHVLAGEAAARVSGEEQPYALAARESLWIREPLARDEIELQGLAERCELVVVRIAWSATLLV